MENEIIIIDDKQYNLKLSETAIEVVEKMTGKPVMAQLAQSDGFLSLNFLRQCFAQGTHATEGGKLPPDHALKIFEAVLKDKGYAFVNMLIVNAIQRDCPFFFQVD